MGRIKGEVQTGKEYSYSANQSDMAYYSDLSKAYNVDFVLIHHLRSSSSQGRKDENSNPLDEVLGSQAIVGGADTILIMEETKKGFQKANQGLPTKRQLYRTGRSPLVQPRTYQLAFDVGSHRTRIIDNSELDETTRERARIRKIMLEMHLKENIYAVSPSDVAKRLGEENTDKTRQTMLRMFYAGKLKRPKYGLYRVADV
jgi:hypothetical protein